MMKLYYLIIALLICCLFNINGQESDSNPQKSKTQKLEIRSSSRSQMSVIRDNNHQRRDLRFLQMNKKVRMNKRNMISYYNTQLKKSHLKKSSEMKKQNAAILRKRQAIQKKRLQRQKQQLRNRLR